MITPSLSHRQPKKWTRVVIEAEASMSEAAAAFLADLTDGVEIVPVSSSPPGARIIAYFPVKKEPATVPDGLALVRSFIKELATRFPGAASPTMHTEIIEEEDWGANWKQHFTTFRITPHLTIKPTWEKRQQEEPPAADDLVIEMDPGLAFGTGHHASTQLALTMIDTLFSAGVFISRVLDVGTGTGVLAMGCGLLGAREVVAIDNDPDAVAAARYNVDHNNLQGIITVTGTPPDRLDGTFDLVVANITHDVLTDLAPVLVALINPTGGLLLAGILRGEQEHSVISVYQALGLNHQESEARDEWVALRFQKGTA